MRILHILDHSLPLHSGYAFRTRAIMAAQRAQGWEAIGLTGLRHSAPGPMIEEAEGLTFYRTPGKATGPTGLAEWREIAALSRAIETLAADFEPDILHAHSPVLTALAALRANRRLKLPLLYEIRAFWEDAAVGNGTGVEGSPKFRAIRALESFAVARADAIAVICEGLRGDLRARGVPADKIMVSPNGVDLELFGAPSPRDTGLAADLDLPPDADVVGFIGSFYGYEGLDDLVAAMPMLVAARPKARLILVGGGPEEAALRAQVAASPVADRFRFVGRVPHREVARYYSVIDLLAFPRKSLRVTELVTPLKPLEAMAQRKLVVASDVGGHRELIEDGVTGTLFPAGDPRALAHALAGLFADRGGWDARRDVARAFVERERNWSSNISRYEPIYRRLVARK